MAITLTTNARVDNVAVVGAGSATWTITGTAHDCRFDDATGSVTINGDVDTLVDNLMIYGGAATVLTVSGSEQTVQAKIHVAAAVNAADISGADNTVDLAVENVRHTGVTVSGNRNRVTLNEQLNQTADDTYDAVIVSGDNNHVTGTAQIEAVNTPQYGANVSGDNNYVCVYCPDATSGETNDAGANNRFCLHTDSDLSGLDATAIHDNVAAEISAIAAKAAPTAADYLVIEDAAAADAKKSITIGTIPVTEAQITDLDHTDTAAIHDNVAAEISAVAAKAVPTAADYLLIEDAAAADAKKSITIGDIPVTEAQISDLDHTDATAIHDNVAAEISAIAAKAVPTTSDYLVIEDAAAGNAKKSITIGDLPTGADAAAIHDNVAAEISAVAAKAAPTASDYLLIEDAAAADAKKSITIGDLSLTESQISDLGAYLLLAGGTMAGDIDMDGNDLLNPGNIDFDAWASADYGFIDAATYADVVVIGIHEDGVGDHFALRIFGPAAVGAGGDLIISSPSDGDTIATWDESDDQLEMSKDIDMQTNGLKNATITGSTITEAQITDLDHTDAAAIHDDTAAEISAVAAKGSPTASDYLLIEDAAAGDAKKSITIGDIDSGLLGDVTDWTTWSPSYSNLTIGNGTVVARYTQIGKTVIARFEFTLGSTSAVGTNPDVSLPVTAAGFYTDARLNWTDVLLQAAGTRYNGMVRFPTTTTARINAMQVSGTNIVSQGVTATAPATWTTADIIAWQVTYEAA